MNDKPLRGCRRGITLIELLVVVAIIAFLAAILFPVLASAKSSSQCRCCQSNLKQLALATSIYTDTYGGKYPIQTKDGVADWNSPTAASNWAKSLEKHVRNARIPVCSYSVKLSDCKTNCSMTMDSASYPISYLGNGKVFGTGITDSMIARPSKTILFQCGGRTWNKCWLAPVKDVEYGEWISYVSRSWCNHNGGTNIAFADSHIEWRSYEKLSRDLSVFDPL
jgi:prepilin-type N-terminal cleavage/methylation domain-containing protein/prepilin-type processing-associated H-X9-DG protein